MTALPRALFLPFGLYLLLLAAAPARAQTTFGPPQVITAAADLAFSVFAADLDGDGDPDVLSASQGDDKIAWYENTDGLGSFGPQQVITANANGASSVFAADLDGDGDQDVLSTSGGGGKIAWYENTDGLGSFGPEQIITLAAIVPLSVFAADLDGDGDQDVLSASWIDDKIAWYEYTDGLGTFGPQQVITSLAGKAFSVFAADLDGDGDQDVLSASQFDNKIAWYENTDGLGNFGPQQVITTLANGAVSVFAADLDGDGDQDVLSASFRHDKIAWYENTDGLGTFGPQRVITTLADDARSVFAADLDGDGDQDVLSASASDDKIAWYENTDGLGSFGPQRVITTLADHPISVFAADLDGDGDQDVLSANRDDDKIAWYENVGPTITVTCTPVNPPIVIPAGGGSFAFDFELVNNGASAETVDIWFDIDGPGVDRTRGPFTLTLAAGGSLMRTLNQNVPSGVPAGDYTHTCFVGNTFPEADDSSSFDFTKSAAFAAGGVNVVDWSTEAEIAAALAGYVDVEAPNEFVLDAAYPNPFNPSTTIRFSLPESAQVRLVVFDVLGREVRVLVDGTREAGTHEVVFDASDLPGGTYLYRLETPQGGFVRTMLLAR